MFVTYHVSTFIPKNILFFGVRNHLSNKSFLPKTDGFVTKRRIMLFLDKPLEKPFADLSDLSDLSTSGTQLKTLYNTKTTSKTDKQISLSNEQNQCS